MNFGKGNGKENSSIFWDSCVLLNQHVCTTYDRELLKSKLRKFPFFPKKVLSESFEKLLFCSINYCFDIFVLLGYRKKTLIQNFGLNKNL